MAAYDPTSRDNPPKRTKTPSIPITSSDSVTEWSRKIREIQREVDRDEEAERKKLEDEIAASRLARASRRNTVISGASAGSSSVANELGSACEYLSSNQ
jgi:hypothetical protein